MASPGTAVVIPAAGNSSRLGLPKQLLQFEQQSLLRRLAERALGLQPAQVLVVLGFESDRMKREVDDLPVQIVLNAGWEEGIASSIRLGIQTLPSSVDAALVALPDQPFIPSSHFGKLIAACSREHPIAATAYELSIGVPACYNRTIFPDLLALSGDSGAKRILERRRGEVVAIPCAEAVIDIDTLADYQKHLDRGRRT